MVRRSCCAMNSTLTACLKVLIAVHVPLSLVVCACVSDDIESLTPKHKTTQQHTLDEKQVLALVTLEALLVEHSATLHTDQIESDCAPHSRFWQKDAHRGLATHIHSNYRITALTAASCTCYCMKPHAHAQSSNTIPCRVVRTPNLSLSPCGTSAVVASSASLAANELIGLGLMEKGRRKAKAVL